MATGTIIIPATVTTLSDGSTLNIGPGSLPATLTPVGNTSVFTPITGNSAYKLIFDDEFNGTSIDASKWAVSSGPDATYPGGQSYCDPNNVTVSGGICSMSVVKPGLSGYNYGSSEMFTPNHTTVAGQPINCYFEALIKPMDNANGLMSGFWTDTNWSFPEADFLEYEQSKGTNIAPTSYHVSSVNDDSFGAGSNFNYGSNLAAGFHVFGFYWTPTSVTRYIDGVVTNTASAISQSHAVWCAILNATTGYIPDGVPDGSTVFPNAMLVKYVHVYSAQKGAVAVTPDAGYGGPGSLT